jgi:hypothetical protein
MKLTEKEHEELFQLMELGNTDEEMQIGDSFNVVDYYLLLII